MQKYPLIHKKDVKNRSWLSKIIKMDKKTLQNQA